MENSSLSPTLLDVLFLLVGSRTASLARQLGYTHTGMLFGLIPIYLRLVDGEPDTDFWAIHRWKLNRFLKKPLAVLWALAWVMKNDGEPETLSERGIQVTGEL